MGMRSCKSMAHKVSPGPYCMVYNFAGIIVLLDWLSLSSLGLVRPILYLTCRHFCMVR